MQILFDAMGTQTQLQAMPPSNRMTTWLQSLTDLGCTYTSSDYTTALGPQLVGVDVFVSLTHQWVSGGNIPQDTNFSYSQQDLGSLQSFVNGGGSILMITNHGQPLGQGPLWPIYDIQLAASLGIQLVFASVVAASSTKPVSTGCPRVPQLQTLSMSPSAGIPSALKEGVTTVEAWDSGGIVVGSGTPIIDLPSGCQDNSGLNNDLSACSFGALYTLGSGKVIVLGHSGIVANYGTCAPSPGQIESADNLRFLNNCITYLGS